jgi:RNA polymerase sigma factor (TIGR02999 family)
MSDVTQILSRIEAGDRCAAEELLPLIYDELRRLAAIKLSQERPGQTLQATALLHEAYLRLVDNGPAAHWDSRGHFYAAAAEAMRRILVENARRKKRLRHGGGQQRLDLEQADLATEGPAEDILALEEALEQFEREEPDKARLVKLRYFAGLGEQQAAETLGISRATAARWWAFSRAWLYDRLK